MSVAAVVKKVCKKGKIFFLFSFQQKVWQRSQTLKECKAKPRKAVWTNRGDNMIMALSVCATERARAEALQKHLNEALKEKEEIKEQLNKTRYQLEIELRNVVTLRQKLVNIREKEEENKKRQDCLGMGMGTDYGKEQLREELTRTRQELLREMELSRRQEERTKSLQQTLALQMEKNGMLIQWAKRQGRGDASP